MQMLIIYNKSTIMVPYAAEYDQGKKNAKEKSKWYTRWTIS